MRGGQDLEIDRKSGPASLCGHCAIQWPAPAGAAPFGFFRSSARKTRQEKRTVSPRNTSMKDRSQACWVTTPESFWIATAVPSSP